MHVFAIVVRNIVDVFGKDYLVTNQEPNVLISHECDITKAAKLAAQQILRHSKNKRIQEVCVHQRGNPGYYDGWTSVNLTFTPEELNS